MTDAIIYAIGLVNGVLLLGWLVERSHRHDHERSIRAHTEQLTAGLRRFNEHEDKASRIDRALDQLYRKTNQSREKAEK